MSGIPRLLRAGALTALATAAGAGAAAVPAGPAPTARLAAFLPMGYPFASAGSVPAHEPLLEADVAYLVREGDPRPARLMLRDPGGMRSVALAPGGALLTVVLAREVSCDPSYSVRIPFAVVTDTTGEEIAAIPNSGKVAWSPDGSRLAMLCGRDSEQGFIGDSVAVLDPRTKECIVYRAPARDLGWLNVHTLLLDDRERVRALDPARGTLVQVAHRGTEVSPDGRYSVRRSPRGARIWDDRTGREITKMIVKLADEEPMREGMAPFWIAARGPGQLLCVPTTEHAFLIDVDGRRQLRKWNGALVAMTPDRSAVLVYREGRFDFEGYE